MSVIEIQERLTQLLEKDYLVDPQVTVFIPEYHDRSVFVTGSVTTPGSYVLPVGKPTSLMSVIAMAEGFTEDAHIKDVRIIREVDGEEQTLHVNAKNIISGQKSKDVEVHPDDVIFVPESFF